MDGTKLSVDGSLVRADASNNSVINKDSLKRYLNKSYCILESRLEETEIGPDHENPPKFGSANKKHVSTTDPDVSVVRQGKGPSKLRYKIHRGVDAKNEIITATEVTPGEVSEAHRLTSLIESHQQITGQPIQTVVGDSQYGTTENYLACHDRRITAHLPPLKETSRGSGRQKDILPKEAFTYNPDNDTFTFPAGQILKKRNYHKKRNHYEYKASAKTCANCKLRKKCTRAKNGCSLRRHVRQDELDNMLQHAHSRQAQKDIKTRQHLMERSFAHSTRYGFKRARWRRPWRVQIQEYLTAAIQNLMILLGNIKEPTPPLGIRMVSEESDKKRAFLSLQEPFFYCKRALMRAIHFLFASRLVEAKG